MPTEFYFKIQYFGFLFSFFSMITTISTQVWWC